MRDHRNRPPGWQGFHDCEFGNHFFKNIIVIGAIVIGKGDNSALSEAYAVVSGARITGKIHLDMLHIQVAFKQLDNRINFAILVLIDDDQLKVLIGLVSKDFKKSATSTSLPSVANINDTFISSPCLNTGFCLHIDGSLIPGKHQCKLQAGSSVQKTTSKYKVV